MSGLNYIASLLQSAHPTLVKSALKEVSFRRGAVIAQQGDAIRFLYLPTCGMVSYTVSLEDGPRIETASIGRNGALGASALFGNKFYLNDVVASLYTTGWTVDVGRASEIAGEQTGFRTLLFKLEQYTTAQAQQIAACNASHPISKRFSGWILRALDESGDGELLITQEEIAHFLGVQRASISVVANGFQDEGLLRYRRGRISVADRAGLERHACSCPAAIRAQYAQLVGGSATAAELAPTLSPSKETDVPARRIAGQSLEI